MCRSPADEFSLGEVAAQAGVPKGSAYHFCEDIVEVDESLPVSLQTELIDDQQRPISSRVRRWQDVITVLTRRAMDHYNRNPASLQLQIGPKTPLVFFRAVELADVMFTLSVLDNGKNHRPDSQRTSGAPRSPSRVPVRAA